MCILDREATSGAGAVPCQGIGVGQLACLGQAQPCTTRLRLLFVPFGVRLLGHVSTAVGLCCPPENYKMAKVPSNRLRMPQQLAQLQKKNVGENSGTRLCMSPAPLQLVHLVLGIGQATSQAWAPHQSGSSLPASEYLFIQA